jgi:hypothetical protein
LPKSGFRCAQVRIVEGLTPTNAPAFSKVNPLPHAATISSAILSENISRPFFAFSIAPGAAPDSSIPYLTIKYIKIKLDLFKRMA